MEQGVAASLESVAKRAGVGIGTLYPLFATRDDLLAATYSDRLLAFTHACREAAPTRDPGAALRAYVEELVVHINIYCGLAASIGMVLQSGVPGCAAVGDLGMTLLRQAQDSGAVRADMAFDDVVHIIAAISLALEQKKSGSQPARIAHLAGLFFDGVNSRPAAA